MGNRPLRGGLLRSKGCSLSRYPAEPPKPPARSQSPAEVPTPLTVVTTPPKRAPAAKAAPRLLSTTQAAAYLGVSANTVRKYRDDGKIRAFHVGERLVKYDPEDLDRFMREFGE